MKDSTVGIDDMALYVPSIYFDIKDLALARQLNYMKLHKGLGLSAMAITDVHEDTATMAANAIAELIDKNQLNPNQIGRIYLGTESALDGSKPTATYALEMLLEKYADQYGQDCFLNCDVVDLTFACIGGVDALQNTLDWVGLHDDRIGIVVCSDNAKYELGSTGEYTQGAGAVALLIKKSPRLIAINDNWGVATMGVHDFFKPLRKASKATIIEEVLEMVGMKNGSVQHLVDKLHEAIQVNGILDANEQTLTLHKETPVFDGQYSNQCYQDRIREAYQHFKQKAVRNGTYQKAESPVQQWSRLIFHLPYAFHGKRIFSEIYVQELKVTNQWAAFVVENNIEPPNPDDFGDKNLYQKALRGFFKGISKTAAYRTFVKEKIEKGQRASSLVGNMYTSSIFLALMSTLAIDAQENNDLTHQRIGFFAYGSGSKAKVFEGQLQENWQDVVAGFSVFEKLKQRTAIGYATYQDLHTLKIGQSVEKPTNEFALVDIGNEGTDEGARYYKWVN